jgi:tetratricopeptide (TPR) repeat protein
MNNKRPTILMAILLLLVAGYLLKPHLVSYYSTQRMSGARIQPPPLAGDNKISNLQVVRDANGRYTAKFDYYYRGEPYPAYFAVRALGDPADRTYIGGPLKKAEMGNHTMEMEIHRPPAEVKIGDLVTKKVAVTLGDYRKASVSAELDYVIEWPNFPIFFSPTEVAKKPTEALYKAAVAAIDMHSRDGMAAAKLYLEQIMLREPGYVPAYAELARVAMKTNWGPEGLSQAESYLNSALRIDPRHANSKVLLGYVYTHQQRYREAEAQLIEASNIGTNNTWLWANWGQLLLMQGKDDPALEKYMRAVEGSRSYDTYDRARLDAYTNLFKLLEKRKLFDKMDSLYRRRAEEFAKYPCFLADYGMFRATHFGDYQAGVSNSRKAMDYGCYDDDARYALGISYYLAWSVLNGEEQNTAIIQARAFFPEGPRLYYELARGDETGKIIPKLITNGSSLRAQDNEKLNALAYALMESNADAAERLVKFGAKFEENVGDEQYPVAFIAFMKQDVKIISLMQKTGVNFARLKFGETNAIDYSKRLGNKAILDIVEKNAKYVI